MSADLSAGPLDAPPNHERPVVLPPDSPVQGDWKEVVTAAASGRPPEQIGRYKIREKLGEGGFGIVHLADQLEPVRRQVALKILKLGMDTRAVIARFEAERQALALMDHPNIAKVLDAGATESGRPFFVMEWVRGVRITEFCDQHHLSTTDRVKLFLQVCSAVQHAHQKGIIHRDIKPSNVLVALQDGVPVPKVIDFGIAKATGGQPLTDKTLVTALEQFLGTPAYMSPEQAQASAQDIDTRSDIYSLGVLLYELLIGVPPFDQKRLVQAGLDEVRRIIHEEDPQPPSTRLRALAGEELTTLAKRRRCDPPKLIHTVRGDLDWIAMKCLEKDRVRRYETVNGLATDLARHLNQEPVSARPPTSAYRFQKFVRRHRLAFGSITAVVAALVLGTVVSVRYGVKAVRAERSMTRLLKEAKTAQAQEASQRLVAEGRLYEGLVREARATRMARKVGFRDRVFALLQQASALDVPGKNPEELLREAGNSLGDFLGLSPVRIEGFPASTELTETVLAPSGGLAAFLLSDQSVVMKELPSGKELGRLVSESPLAGGYFSGDESQLVLFQAAPRGRQELAYRTWAKGTNGAWLESARASLPGAQVLVSPDRTAVVGTSATNLTALIEFLSRMPPYPQLRHVLVDNSSLQHIEVFSLKERRVVLRAPRPEAGMKCFGLSLDGRLLAWAVPEGEKNEADSVEIWSLEDGRRLGLLHPRLGSLANITLGPDGRHIACLSMRGCVVYAIEGLEQLTKIREYFHLTTPCVFAPGTDLLALPIAKHSRVLLWDAERAREVAMLDGLEGANQVSFSADGDLLLVAGLKTAWAFRRSALREKLEFRAHDGRTEVCMSPDGSRLVTSSSDKYVKVWTVNGRLLWSARLPKDGRSLGFSPNGRYVAAGMWATRQVTVWDAQSGSRLLDLMPDTPGIGWSVQFSPDSRFLATASYSQDGAGGVTLWALSEGEGAGSPTGLTAKPVKHHSGSYWGLVFSPDGHHLAFHRFVPAPRDLFSWDLGADGPPQFVAANALSGVRFSADSKRLVFFTPSWELVAMQVAGASLMSAFSTADPKQATGRANNPCLSLNYQGTELAMASVSGLGVEVWDPTHGRLLYALPDGPSGPDNFSWTADGEQLAIGHTTGDVEVWNLGQVRKAIAALQLPPASSRLLGAERLLEISRLLRPNDRR